MLGTKKTHETVWKPSSFHNMRFFLSCLLQKKNKWNMLEEQPPVKQQKRDSESI